MKKKMKNIKNIALALSVLVYAIMLIDVVGIQSQSTPQPVTLIYVSVEPPKSGLVRFTTEDGLVDRWPQGGFLTESFYLIALPQREYLYILVEPYGCHEVLNIDISPENIILKKERDRAIAYLTADYVTVRAVLYELTEDVCEYFAIGTLSRVRKMDVFYATIFICGALISTVIAYEVKGKLKLKKEAREWYEREFKERYDFFRRNFKTINYVETDDPLCLTVYTMLDRSYDLDKQSRENLYKAVVDDEMLNTRLNILRQDLRYHDPLSAFLKQIREYGGESYLTIIGLKTYLAMLGLMPSSSRVFEDYLMEGLYPYKRIEITDKNKVFQPLIDFVKERSEIHEKSLRNVYELLNKREEYRDRIYNPHPFYSTILKEIKNRTGYKIDLSLKPISVEERAEELIVEEPKPIIEETEKEEPKKIKIEEVKPVERAFKIEDVPFPEEMKPAIKSTIEKKEKIYGEQEIIEEKKEEPKITIELPKYLRRQIEGLKIPVHEIVESSRKYLEAGKGNGKTLFREANKLVDKYGTDMDENSKISMLTMLTTIIPLIAREIESMREVEEKPLQIKAEASEAVEHLEEVSKSLEKVEERVEVEKQAIKSEVMKTKEEKPSIHGKKKISEEFRIREVDYKYRIAVSWGQIYLIPYFNVLPTFIAVDMIDRSKSHPIPIEMRWEKIFEEINKAVTLGKTPVIVLGKMGYLHEKHRKYREYYVRKLEDVIRVLRDKRLLDRVGFLMLEKIYFKYDGFGLKEGWDVFRLNLKVPDKLHSLVESLRKNSWIDEKVVDVLMLPPLLSPKIREALAVPTKLLDEAIKEVRNSGDREAEAVLWALKNIIQVKRPLLEEEIPREYENYVITLKQLRLLKEARKTV